MGDPFVCGLHAGRVRALLDERGRNVDEVGPSVPVQVLGLGGVPQAGDSLQVMEADRAARRRCGAPGTRPGQADAHPRTRKEDRRLRRLGEDG